MANKRFVITGEAKVSGAVAGVERVTAAIEKMQSKSAKAGKTNEKAFDLAGGGPVQMPTTGGLDADGIYHATWSAPGKDPKPDPPGLKAEARRLTRVRRLRYYPLRVTGDTIELHPAYDETAVRIELFGDEIDFRRDYARIDPARERGFSAAPAGPRPGCVDAGLVRGQPRLRRQARRRGRCCRQRPGAGRRAGP